MEKHSSRVVFNQRVTNYKKRLSRQFRRNMTPAEALLWKHVRGNQISGIKFRRQQIISGFVADFFCHKANLVVEVDGGIHDEPDQKEYDEHRTEVFKTRGLSVLRFKNKAVLNETESVIQKITDEVKARLNSG